MLFCSFCQLKFVVKWPISKVKKCFKYLFWYMFHICIFYFKSLSNDTKIIWVHQAFKNNNCTLLTLKSQVFSRSFDPFYSITFKIIILVVSLLINGPFIYIVTSLLERRFSTASLPPRQRPHRMNNSDNILRTHAYKSAPKWGSFSETGNKRD